VYPLYVHPPRNPAELAKAMGPYCALGLNGAFESTDAVHVHWGKLYISAAIFPCSQILAAGMCPADKKILHTGKEGYPTIVYNVSCDHAGMAHHVTSGTYGSCNDKSIIRMDTHIGTVRCRTQFLLFLYVR